MKNILMFYFGALFFICFTSQLSAQINRDSEETIEQRVRIQYLENQQKVQNEANSELRKELEQIKSVNDSLKNKESFLQKWETQLGFIFILVGIIVPLISLFVVKSKVDQESQNLQLANNNFLVELEKQKNNIEKETKEITNYSIKLRDSIEEIELSKKQIEIMKLEITQYSIESKEKMNDIISRAKEEELADSLDSMQKVLNEENKKASPFEKEWATALKHHYRGEYYNALTSYSHILNNYESQLTFSNVARVYARMAMSYYQEQNYFMALQLYDSALMLNPYDVRAWYNKAVILIINMVDFNKADYCLDRIIDIITNPEDEFIGLKTKALINKGFIKEKTKNLDAAIQFYDKAIQLDTNNARAYVNKGKVLMQLNKVKEAKICFDLGTHFNSKEIELQEEIKSFLKTKAAQKN